MALSILVPLDGSDLAEQALPTAVSLARNRSGSLELAVVHTTRRHHGFSDAPWNAMTESMRYRYAADKADQLRLASDRPVGHALLHGSADTEICRRAHAVNADLIVMSSHGRTGLSRALSGSVADDVIRQSCKPVLLLRAPGDDAPTRTPPLDFRRIVIPLDPSSQSHQILPAAAALGAPGETRYFILRVVVPIRLPVAEYYVAGPIEDRETAVLVTEAERDVAAAAAEIRRLSGCEVETRVITSDGVAEAILDFAYTAHVDLIALTTHGRGPSRMLVGSVTDAVMRGCDLPLLVLHPRP